MPAFPFRKLDAFATAGGGAITRIDGRYLV